MSRDKMKQNLAALAERTQALRAQNDRLAAILGVDWVRELSDREHGIPAKGGGFLVERRTTVKR